MKLGVCVPANKLAPREFHRWVRASVELAGQVQLTVEGPHGWKNVEWFARQPWRKNVDLALHAPHSFIDCLALDEEAREFALAQVRKAARLAAKLDAELVTVHLGRVTSRTNGTPELKAALKASLRELNALSREEGVTLALENLPPKADLRGYPGFLDETRQIIRQTAGSRLKFCLDTGHAVRAGSNPDAFARAYGSRLACVHVHDAKPGKDHLPVGKGKINFARLAKTLRDVHYQGRVDIEVFGFPQPPLDYPKLYPLFGTP